MAYANKTYVAFDADNDIRYYQLMKAWKSNSSVEFNFYDAHDLNNLRDSSSEETIKRKLADRMTNAKLLVLLVGDNTRYLYKFVRWEIEQALSTFSNGFYPQSIKPRASRANKYGHLF